MTKNRFTIADVLAPLTVETFFNEYWEKKPLIVSDRSPNHYEQLVSLEDVEGLIYYGAQGTNDVKYVKGRQPGYSNYVREKTPPTVLAYEAYTRGYTIVVNNLAARHPAIAAFTRALEDAFNCPTQVNSYLTPPDSQGFDAHYDTHDVFVLQLTGSKRWFVYDSIGDRLPLEGRARPLHPSELPEKAPMDFVLRAGEALYLPRGFVHYANTADESSLHLTVGVHNTRWADLITRAITALSRREVRLRESVPPGYLTGQGLSDELESHFRDLLELVSQKASLGDAADLLSDALIFDRPTVPDGHFTQLDRVEKIALDTRLVKRTGALYRLIGNDQSSTIQFSGNIVRGPRKVTAALQYALDNAEFTVRELPGLSDNEKIAVAKSFVKEGFARAVE